jgi:hypothetical protein
MIGPVHEPLVRLILGIDDGDIRLRPEFARPEFDAGALHCNPTLVLSGQRIIEQTFEISRDAVVRDRWRRHHHRDTCDKLPAFMVRAAFLERAEPLAGHAPGPGGFFDSNTHRRLRRHKAQA